METINNVELKDKDIYPDEKVLESIIGESYQYYLSLLKLFDEYELNDEWRYYHDGKTWLCKVQKKKKTIIWMSAWKGYMQATIYVPEARIQEIFDLDLSARAKEKIKEAKRVGKSQPCTFEIRDELSIQDLKKVMLLKLNWK
ncbi:MAG: DUF3788 family protein [Syntrophomonadaceae bacterium]|nr:DUF3788 family protein [Syntrophomonadaceae bacterium]